MFVHQSSIHNVFIQLFCSNPVYAIFNASDTGISD